MGAEEGQAYYEAVSDGEEKHGKGQNYQMPENPNAEVMPCSMPNPSATVLAPS